MDKTKIIMCVTPYEYYLISKGYKKIGIYSKPIEAKWIYFYVMNNATSLNKIPPLYRKKIQPLLGKIPMRVRILNTVCITINSDGKIDFFPEVCLYNENGDHTIVDKLTRETQISIIKRIKKWLRQEGWGVYYDTPELIPAHSPNFYERAQGGKIGRITDRTYIIDEAQYEN